MTSHRPVVPARPAAGGPPGARRGDRRRRPTGPWWRCSCVDPRLWGPAGGDPTRLPRGVPPGPRRVDRRPAGRAGRRPRCRRASARRGGRGRRGRRRRRPRPYGIARDAAVAAPWPAPVGRSSTVGSPYAVAPGTVRNGAGDAVQGLHARSRGPGRAHGWAAPVRGARRVPWATGLASDGSRPRPRSDADAPRAGEAAAKRGCPPVPRAAPRRLRRRRDAPARRHVPPVALPRWGCIHPRQLLARLDRAKADARFRNELCWREFYADVLSTDPTPPAHASPPRWERWRSTPGRPADDALRRVVRGPHRLPDRRRRHAPAARPRAGCTTGCG